VKKPFSALKLDTQWTECSGTEGDVQLRFDQEGTPIEFSARRCADGRLRNAYPVSAHDVVLDVLNGAAAQQIMHPLAVLTQAILNSDNSCRRVVFAAPADDHALVAAAQAAGFRYVLDVDVPGAELSLLVAEPRWVTDFDNDRVPGA
jgi:hypothetical protein